MSFPDTFSAHFLQILLQNTQGSGTFPTNTVAKTFLINNSLKWALCGDKMYIPLIKRVCLAACTKYVVHSIYPVWLPVCAQGLAYCWRLRN